MNRLLAAFFFVLMIVTAAADEIAPPAVQESKGPQQPVEAWNGSFVQSIDLEVPAFRGLEPKLSLSYDSARGIRNIPNAGGWLGVGWSVDGLSVIERVSGSAAPAAGTDKKSGGRGLASFGAAGFPANS